MDKAMELMCIIVEGKAREVGKYKKIIRKKEEAHGPQVAG
jgi:hypothetical protein